MSEIIHIEKVGFRSLNLNQTGLYHPGVKIRKESTQNIELKVWEGKGFGTSELGNLYTMSSRLKA